VHEKEKLKMNQTLGQVIRKHQVKDAGSCRLDHDAVYARQPLAAAAKSKPAAAPQVRIVENTPQGVVLECICSCGTKTYIQCDYNSMEK
jgi:hypothetical protein